MTLSQRRALAKYNARMAKRNALVSWLKRFKSFIIKHGMKWNAFP